MLGTLHSRFLLGIDWLSEVRGNSNLAQDPFSSSSHSYPPYSPVHDQSEMLESGWESSFESRPGVVQHSLHIACLHPATASLMCPAQPAF